jgi:hypothetical protein
MKMENFIKAEAPSTDLLYLAAQGQLAKAQVHGYEREDGTKVKPHERAVKPAQATLEQQAGEHAQMAAQHEQAASRCGAGHPRHGLHVEMSALHLAACRYAHRANDPKLDGKTREAATQARAHLKKLLADRARALNGQGGKNAGESKGKVGALMTKAKGIPVFFKATAQKVKPRGPNLSNLIAEMEAAQTLAKSRSAELWVHGGAAFA